MPRTFSLLLVDDDADDQLIFMEALRNLGLAFEVQSARDGVDAVKMMESPSFEIPDIAFFDLNMPRMNGKELLVKFRKNRKLDAVPVIVFSTSSRPDDITHCLKLGANAYLTKQGSFNSLCNDLREMLNLHLVDFKDSSSNGQH